MLSYAVTSPLYPRVSLRLCAQLLDSMRVTGLWKCVLQVVEAGHPILDPVSIEWRTNRELQAWIEASRRDGWTFTPDNRQARCIDTQAQRNRDLTRERMREIRASRRAGVAA